MTKVASVYVWFPDTQGESKQLGHSSMFIGNLDSSRHQNPFMSDDRGKRLEFEKKCKENAIEWPQDPNYVSWWAGKKSISAYRPIFDAGNTASYHHDCIEEQRPADSVYHIHSPLLYTAGMTLCWRDIKQNAKAQLLFYNLTSRNCCNVVWEVLQAGGIRKGFGTGLKSAWITHNNLWTPKGIAMVCDTLRDRYPDWVDKVKYHGRVKKSDNLLATLFRLR